MIELEALLLSLRSIRSLRSRSGMMVGQQVQQAKHNLVHDPVPFPVPAPVPVSGPVTVIQTIAVRAPVRFSAVIALARTRLFRIDAARRGIRAYSIVVASLSSSVPFSILSSFCHTPLQTYLYTGSTGEGIHQSQYAFPDVTHSTEVAIGIVKAYNEFVKTYNLFTGVRAEMAKHHIGINWEVTQNSFTNLPDDKLQDHPNLADIEIHGRGKKWRG